MKGLKTLSYLPWLGMLGIAAVNTLSYVPLASGERWIAVSGLLALAAAVQLVRTRGLLPRTQVGLAGVVLVLFCAAQVVQLSRSNGPASVSRGIDFSAYYIAGKLVAERPVPSLYVLPLLPDGRLNLNTEVEKTSPWYAAAARYDVPYASPFIYPPLFAVLMKPLAHLSFWNAYLLWSVLTVLLAVAAVALSLQVADVAINGGLARMVGGGAVLLLSAVGQLVFRAGGRVDSFPVCGGRIAVEEAGDVGLDSVPCAGDLD
jgi:hypothetical protein